MIRYCLNCDAPLSNVWPWTTHNGDGLCFDYDDALWAQGGETEFQHQAVKITPEAGKLVLFPPFWTHLHRGKTLQSGIKYIATTWVGFA